jgi:hypothetical protein
MLVCLQVCKAGMTAGQSRKIWLTRHGESCFNMAARIGGDSGLTARGEEYARLLPDVLESRLPAVSGGVMLRVCIGVVRVSATGLVVTIVHCRSLTAKGVW